MRVDRVLFRPYSSGGAAIQIKVPEYLIRGQYMSLRVRAPPPGGSLDSFYLFACAFRRASPWLAPSFYFIPASILGSPPSGWWRLSLPIEHGRGSKYDRFRHPLSDLASVLSRALDGGPAYPFPPSRFALRRLTPPAAGKILENEAASLSTVLSDGRLQVWSPLADTGEDLALANASQSASLRVQVKGSLGPLPRAVMSAHIQKRTFRESRFNLVLVLLYDVPALALWPRCYLFRTDELDALGLSADKQGFYRFEAPAGARTASKYRPWQWDLAELPAALETALSLLAAEGPDALVPTARSEVQRARLRLLRAAR